MGNKKRASSPTNGAGNSKSSTAPAEKERIEREEEEGMGEFEDEWDDELEGDEDAGQVIDAAEHSGDDEEEEGMSVDGDQDEPEPLEEEEEEEERAPSPVPFLPTGVLKEGEHLEPDLSTYPLLHSFIPTWPSLSFDILRDHLGEERVGYPVGCSLVAGTQAQDRSNNEVTVMRWEGLVKTRKEDGGASMVLDIHSQARVTDHTSPTTADLSDEEDSDEEDTDDDPILTFRSIPHVGGVNRIRARPLSLPLSLGPPKPPLPYHIATFSETGKVHIFDIAPQLDSLLYPENGAQAMNKLPVFTIDSHGRNEGFALDWGSPIGSSATSGGRLLSGDIAAKIFLTTMSNTSFTPSPKPFLSHTASVEDLQWSPNEPTVFASCSADKSIRIWDIRVKDRKSVLGVKDAHDEDVNVISWNKGTDFLIASGGDEGGIKVWDLRNFKGTKAPTPKPVASFNWHTAPITSIEWHPTDTSSFAASGADDQITLWDLSVEADDDEVLSRGEALKDVPAQLLFVHQGQKEIKEVHWCPQVPGCVVSTALDGFNIWKSLPFA